MWPFKSGMRQMLLTDIDAGPERHFKVLFCWASISLQLSLEHLFIQGPSKKQALMPNAYETRENGLTAISSSVTCTRPARKKTTAKEDLEFALIK